MAFPAASQLLASDSQDHKMRVYHGLSGGAAAGTAVVAATATMSGDVVVF